MTNAQELANKVQVIIYGTSNVKVSFRTERYLSYPELLTMVTAIVTSSITPGDTEK